MGLTNAELGLVLTTVAGSATALGAAVVFSERLVQLASKPFLAGALGLSSGVMLYVSFVVIFVKALDGFADSSAFGDSDAYLMATAALFGGMGFMSGLDALVHWLDPNRSAHHASDPRKHMVRASGVLFLCSSLACVLTCPYVIAATLSPRRWRTGCTILYGGAARFAMTPARCVAATAPRRRGDGVEVMKGRRARTILPVNCDPHRSLSLPIIKRSASSDAERWFSSRFASWFR